MFIIKIIKMENVQFNQHNLPSILKQHNWRIDLTCICACKLQIPFTLPLLAGGKGKNKLLIA